MSEIRTVSIGESRYKIARFKGYKGLVATRIVARAFEQTQDVIEAVASFEEGYRDKHRLKITDDLCSDRLREVAEQRRQVNDEQGQAEGDEDQKRIEQALRVLTDMEHIWQGRQESVKAAERGYIELPQPPSGFQTFAVGFSAAFEKAEKEVLQLLALCVAENSELKAAYKKDDREGVDDLLDKLAEELLDGEFEELLDLAVAAGEMLESQLSQRLEGAGKLQALVQRAQRKFLGTSESEDETSTKTSPTSSTPSPTPTDGDPDESSLESPGRPLAPSPSA